jgi:hypothetical protein
MPTRLIIAYFLILLLVAQGAGIVWWRIYHSPKRSYAREQSRRRRSDAARAVRAMKEDQDG